MQVMATLGKTSLQPKSLDQVLMDVNDNDHDEAIVKLDEYEL